MDVSKFNYKIDPEVKAKTYTSFNRNKGDSSRYEQDWESPDDYIVKPKPKKKVNPAYYDEDYERPPKEETYYIVYNNVEFVILAKKLRFLDEFRQIVLDNNGEFNYFEDEFYDSRDTEKVVEILKEKFSNNDWFIPTLAKSIEEMFTNTTSFDDLTFDMIKKRFFMLDDEVLYEAITYLANK